MAASQLVLLKRPRTTSGRDVPISRCLSGRRVAARVRTAASAEHSSLHDQIDDDEDPDQSGTNAKQDPQQRLLSLGDARATRRTLVATCDED